LAAVVGEVGQFLRLQLAAVVAAGLVAWAALEPLPWVAPAACLLPRLTALAGKA
jgi:hypothetical protein